MSRSKFADSFLFVLNLVSLTVCDDRYLPGGDLLNYCNNNRLPLPETSVHTIFKGLIRALRYLHVNNIVHADVKLENCLFGTQSLESLSIVDFGLSIFVADVRKIPEGMRGTLNYMAPELLLANRAKPIMP